MTTSFFHSAAIINNKMTETVKQLRDYGRFLGIRGLWRKNKEQLREHERIRNSSESIYLILFLRK